MGWNWNHQPVFHVWSVRSSEEGKMNHFSVAQLLLTKRGSIGSSRLERRGEVDSTTDDWGVWEKIREIFYKTNTSNMGWLSKKQQVGGELNFELLVFLFEWDLFFFERLYRFWSDVRVLWFLLQVFDGFVLCTLVQTRYMYFALCLGGSYEVFRVPSVDGNWKSMEVVGLFTWFLSCRLLFFNKNWGYKLSVWVILIWITLVALLNHVIFRFSTLNSTYMFMKLVLLVSLKMFGGKLFPQLDGNQKNSTKKSQGQRLCVWPSNVVPIRWPDVGATTCGFGPSSSVT